MPKRKIDMQIALEGGDDVARQFAELARAGEQAFAKVRAAANENRKIDLNLPKLKREIEEVGKAGQQAFQQVGQAASQAGQQVTQQAGFFSTLAGRITIVAGSLTALAAGYLAAAKAASETVVALGRQADAAKLSITNFQNLRGTLTQLNLTEDEAGKAASKFGEALRTAFDEGKKALEGFGVKFAPITNITEQGALSFEQYSKALLGSESAARSLGAAIQALGSVTTNGNTQFSETSRILLSMGAVINANTGKVREGAEAWFPFVRGVRAMGDETKQAALLNKIFGEDIARVLLPAIRQSDEAFVAALGSIRALNLGFTDAQRKVGQDMVNAFTRLKLATSQARTEFGLAFAPVFTPAINAFADAIRRNQSVITGFVNQLVTLAKPAIDGFFGAITRFLDSPANFDTLRDNIVAVGTAISQIFKNVIVPAFTAFGRAATSVATAVGNLFGLEISPALAGLGVIVTGLIGPFNALALAVAAVFGGEGQQFDAFRQRLAALGIDIEAIKTRLSGIFDAVIAELPGIIATVVVAFNAVKTVLEFVADTINTIFGTNVTAAGLAVVAVIGTITGAFTVLIAVLAPIAAIMGIVVSGMVAVTLAVKTLAIGLGALQTVIAIVGAIITGLAAAFASPAIAIAAVVTALAALVAALILFPDQVKAAFTAAWDFIVAGANAAIDLIIAGFSALVTSIVGLITTAFSGLVEIIVAPFRTAANIIIGIWNRVIDIIREALSGARETGSIGGNIPGMGGAPFAAGGYTGSGGTRQIAGFVHGGEYVQPARVVRQPGVLAFMDTLRRVGDLQKTIQLFTRGFSVGGLVDNFSARLSSLVIPKFASGGLVPALAPASRLPDFGTVTLDFGRGQRVRGIADRQIVEALRRIAIQDQRLVAGRESS